MVFGPCGGVQPDGGCEMLPEPCVFAMLVEPEPPDWPLPATPVVVPRVLTDLSTPPGDVVTLRDTVAILAGSCDAVLVGEHQDRPDFPPSVLARLIASAGLRPWVTLACRDRNRIGLEQELRALALQGDVTALCVTGDGRAYDVRPDVTQVFDLDGTRLTALAAGLGLPVAVPETPTAPPRALRPARLVQKQRAGAGVAVLNHVGSPAAVAAFVTAARAAGLTIPVVASAVVFTDHRSAAVLDGLPGLELDGDDVAAVLDAADPVSAGIDRAVAEAVALLAVDGVEGVNLSGSASSAGVAYAAEIQAEVGRRIQEGTT